METMVKDLLQDKVNEVYLHFQKQLNISSGDISPEDWFEQDKAINTLADIIAKVLTYQSH